MVLGAFGSAAYDPQPYLGACILRIRDRRPWRPLVEDRDEWGSLFPGDPRNYPTLGLGPMRREREERATHSLKAYGW
jgi:hypothetical protein